MRGRQHERFERVESARFVIAAKDFDHPVGAAQLAPIGDLAGIDCGDLRETELLNRICRVDDDREFVERENMLIAGRERIRVELVVERLDFLRLQAARGHADDRLALDQRLGGGAGAMRLQLYRRARAAGFEGDFLLLLVGQFRRRLRAETLRIGLDQHWHEPLADRVRALHAETPGASAVRARRRGGRQRRGAGIDIDAPDGVRRIFQRLRRPAHIKQEFPVARFEPRRANLRAVEEAEDRRMRLGRGASRAQRRECRGEEDRRAKAQNMEHGFLSGNAAARWVSRGFC